MADEEYRAAVEAGHSAQAVLTPTSAAIERARTVLADVPVRDLRYYGPLA